jgi:dihydrofolate synthase/folylpolyglutamate synthase
VIESQSVDEQAYRAALGFLYDRINYERMASGSSRYHFWLQRTDQLLIRLGLSGYLHSQTDAAKIPIVHIAGTKGKGSTSAMVAAALTAAGMKTGLYTSPHLHHLEERFKIDGRPCSQAELVALVDRIEPVARAIGRDAGREPSFFELTTVIALLHFDTSDCDAVVLEVGLGGRLDSTNVCAPSVTAITSIGLDHEHILGHSLGEIAAQKAGIIKPGVPVVSGVGEGEAAEVIQARCCETSSPLFQRDREFSVQSQPAPHWGSRLTYQGHVPPLSSRADIEIPLEGVHQAGNAAIALAILDLLRDQGLKIDQEAASRGIAGLECPGRIERFDLPDQVTAIVDAAHNADSIKALCRCLTDRAGDRQIAIVFGTSHDKNADTMLQQLSPLADHLMLTRFTGNPRFKPAAELLELVPPDKRTAAQVIEQPIAACSAALAAVNPGGMLVICGSFFLAAETREWLASQALPN